jgi:uncharacterized protein
MTTVEWVAVVLAVSGIVVFLSRVADRVVQPVPSLPERSVADSGLPHEDLSIPVGGQELAAWLVSSGRSEPDAPLLLMAHGWGANYGTVLRLAEPLVKGGHDVMLFDMRGHGRNAPARHVTVRHLRDDVAAMVRYAADRFPGRPLVLAGHSLGGAASVLAVAEGAPVAGLILIATPSDVPRITAEYLTDKGLPGGLLVKVLRPFWWWRLGGTFRPHSPARRVREVSVPVLLIQPEHDRRVSRAHADRLSAAAGVPYHLVPDREHIDVLDAPVTVDLVRGFLATAERGARRVRAETPAPGARRGP